MGELRTAVLALVDRIEKIDAVPTTMLEKAREANRALEHMAQTITASYETLYLSLLASYKKRFMDIDHYLNFPLSDAEDAGAPKLVAGVNSFRESMRKRVVTINGATSELIATYEKAVIAAVEECKRLTKIAEKKKSGLLKSKAYKDKIKSYLLTLEQCAKALGTLKADASAGKRALHLEDWVDSAFPAVTMKTTIGDLKKVTGTNFAAEVTEYKNDMKRQDAYLKSWRDHYVPVGPQLKVLRKFAVDADAMEKEPGL